MRFGGAIELEAIVVRAGGGIWQGVEAEYIIIFFLVRETGLKRSRECICKLFVRETSLKRGGSVTARFD